MGSPKALKPGGDDLPGQFRAIAIPAEVAEVKPSELRRNDLLDDVRGAFVREMAVPAENALLQAPGTARIVLQHLHVVIGFQKKNVRTSDAFDNKFRGVAEIGEKSNVAGLGMHEETDRIIGVMRNWKGIDADIANLEGCAGGKDLRVDLDL